MEISWVILGYLSILGFYVQQTILNEKSHSGGFQTKAENVNIIHFLKISMC